MSGNSQEMSNHTRWLPAFHYFALPVLFVNVIVELVALVRAPSGEEAWEFVVAVALATLVLLARTMPLTAQDRLIRFEETTRMQRVLPAAMHGEIAQLSRSDFVALRFASDEELPDMVRRVRAGEFASQKDIKKAIRNWRADFLRV